jgi:endonuclease/exonuclease/phosphatase family metal-dependent hydrolase
MKVMTLNINFYGDRYGDWPARKQLIRDVLDKAGPDVVALQAVRRDPQVEYGEDQAAQLTTFFSGSKYVAYQPAEAFPNGVSQGSAILSRLPIAEQDLLPLTLLPDREDTNRRIVQSALFELPTGPFYLFNAHFSWIAEQAEQNIADTLPWVNAVEGPAMLVGDLNTPPDSPLLDRLRRSGWDDAWDLLCPGSDGYTYREGGELTKRIDYAWVNQSLRDRVQTIERIADEPAGVESVFPSDHAGLLVSLSLLVNGTINGLEE